MKKNEIICGKIHKVNFPNKGIMYIDDNTPVVVADSLVGQELEVRLGRKRKSKWQGFVVQTIKNPDYFIEPACKYFGVCGGCSLQLLPYDKQLEHKETQVKNILPEIEKFTGIVASPSDFEYRNKMEFSFGDAYKDGPMELGMHRKRTTFDIITVDGCKIVDPDFSVVLREVLNYMVDNDIPFYKKKVHEGTARFLVVRRSQTTGELLINLVTSSQGGYDFLELANYIAGLDIKVAGFLHTISDTLADAVKPETVKVLYGRDVLTEEILGLKFEISPFSFFQTNTKGAEVLYSTALGMLSDIEDKTVFDLYSGTGTIAQIMALRAKKVYGIEIVAEAVEKAKENAKLNGLTNCEFVAGDVLEMVDNLTVVPDTIVVDPPREGIHPKAIQKIANFGAKEILYISCKPTSLAKDLIAFGEAGYEIVKMCAVDMFPQTVHVESVALLAKK
ncbi:MAG: 23S rRNA (uracil-5-)-methyltransferase RumA [Epulopiscium sp. Nele67-Bin004]|nr:MAG: 23S rRNA (uracil-5-)-methyltransferase RumA [Epulopiscium sp. Nele67-Bin004]